MPNLSWRGSFSRICELSEHFMLSELVHSDTAARLHLNNESLSQDHSLIFSNSASSCWSRLREGGRQSSKVSSGFREDEAERLQSEAILRQPTLGDWAADINAFRNAPARCWSTSILSIKVKFDQVIFEGTWVHVGLYQPNH
jgi:zinc D-Ala-D-Ala carboxypeptidase